MKNTSLISMAVFLLGGCAVGAKFDLADSADDDKVPLSGLPELIGTGNPVDHSMTYGGTGGVGGVGGVGGDADDPQGTGGSSDQSSSSVSSSSVSSTSSVSSGGATQVYCNPGLTSCGDVCYDIAVDVLNCGVCGHHCKDGQFCSEGKCNATAVLYVSGDDACDLYLDGKVLVMNKNWFVATKVTLTLTAEAHVFAILGKNAANGSHPGAVIMDLSVGSARIVTGSDWDVSTSFVIGWELPMGALLKPVPSVPHDGIFNTIWWNRDPNTFAAKNFPDDSQAKWIWSQGFLTDSVVYFRKEFVVE